MSNVGALLRSGLAGLISLLLVMCAISVQAMAKPGLAHAADPCLQVGGTWSCAWNANIGPNSWRFFTAAEPKRNWWRNTGNDTYANPVGKCVRVGNGSGWIYAQTCNYTHLVSQTYPTCNCGGLFAGTKNLAGGVRYILSHGFH